MTASSRVPATRWTGAGVALSPTSWHQTIASQSLQRGLVDEILVYVLPVLLGDGIRFSSPGLARMDLQPLSSARSGDATILRFRVGKEFDPADG